MSREIKLKQKILKAFIQKFETELEGVARSAKAAHEAATHEESKPEDSHDTRGVEASYLAGAQAARGEELKQVILEYKSLISSLDENTRTAVAGAAVGSLIIVQPLISEDDLRPKGAPIHALIALRGGGTNVEVDGTSYSVFTPSSPIGEAVFGAAVGEQILIESKAGNRAYQLVSIQ